MGKSTSRKKSTTRTPPASPTFRRSNPIGASRKSLFPMFAGGMILGFGLVLLLGLLAFRSDSKPERVDAPVAARPPVAAEAAPEKIEPAAPVVAVAPSPIAPPRINDARGSGTESRKIRVTIERKGTAVNPASALPATRAGAEEALPEVVSIAAQDPAAPQKDPPPPPQAIDQRRVDDAIRKGVAFLKASGVKESMALNAGPGLGETPELILWTLLHSGNSDADPEVLRLLQFMLNRKLERTYAVALQAMILEELNRVKFQGRITQCAQFLVDAQCANGQWTYTGPLHLGTPTTATRADVSTSGKPESDGPPGTRAKPKVLRTIAIQKSQDGPASGDNSNSQYAALGLRACQDAGIRIPKSVLERGRRWWRDAQHAEEGAVAGQPPAVATGVGSSALPAGWCYGSKDHGHKPYPSMTAGAVGSLAIYGYLLEDKNWKNDAALQKGLAWLDRHFSVTTNEGVEFNVDPGWMLFYYLYALERAGVLCGTEAFGAHRWYAEGAAAILGAQKPDGSWIGPSPQGDRSLATNAVWDTCFAILFLRRATRPLEDIASTDERARK